MSARHLRTWSVIRIVVYLSLIIYVSPTPEDITPHSYRGVFFPNNYCQPDIWGHEASFASYSRCGWTYVLYQGLIFTRFGCRCPTVYQVIYRSPRTYLHALIVRMQTLGPDQMSFNCQLVQNQFHRFTETGPVDDLNMNNFSLLPFEWRR